MAEFKAIWDRFKIVLDSRWPAGLAPPTRRELLIAEAMVTVFDEVLSVYQSAKLEHASHNEASEVLGVILGKTEDAPSDSKLSRFPGYPTTVKVVDGDGRTLSEQQGVLTPRKLSVENCKHTNMYRDLARCLQVCSDCGESWDPTKHA